MRSEIDPAFLVAYSKDRDAVEQLRHWQDRARGLPFWKRKERAEAQAQAEAARQRCIDAGVDWETVPLPPEGFRAPDRSARPLIGTARVSAASVAPVAGAMPAAARGAGAAAHAVGGAATGFVGGVAGAAAFSWLQSDAQQLHQGQDGSAFFEAAGGGIWYADPSGGVFALGGDGWLAADPAGFMWVLTDAGEYATWAADGTLVTLAENGSLVAFTETGDTLTLGEDGSFYFSGADGGFYTLGAGGAFYGVDENGDYFQAPEGSGFSADELASSEFVDDSGAAADDEWGLF